MVEKAGRTLKSALAMALLAAALTPAVTLAGRYHVYSCRTPSGEPAPTDGWSGSVSAGNSHDEYAIDSCGEGGALIAALGDDASYIPGLDIATWAFAPPPHTTIADATLWRAGDNAGGGNVLYTYEFWAFGATSEETVEPCGYSLGCEVEGDVGVPFAPTNRLVVPIADLSGGLSLEATCGDLSGSGNCAQAPGDANGYSSAIYLYAADIILEQSMGPTVSEVGSELASEPVVHGTSFISFDAADAGSGIWKAVVEVDGQVTQTVNLGGADDHCREVGQTTDGLPAFLYLQPCPPTVSADVGVDTTKLSNGTHHLLVDVVDAAGNSTTVVNRAMDVQNAPSACAGGGVKAAASSTEGTLAVSFKGSETTTLTSQWGRRQTVVGRLTGPGGTPISGAAVTVTATPRSSGGASVAIGSPRTGPDGRFTVEVPGTLSSRTLCLAYPSTAVGGALEATLRLNRRAGLALHVHPHTTSVGHTIHFTGSLLGGPVPPGGKALVLEARSPGGRWIEFDVIHTGPRGRFTAGYTFKFEGPARYQFRAVSEEEADYPYATGASNLVGVFER